MCFFNFFRFIIGWCPESSFGAIHIEPRNSFFVVVWLSFIPLFSPFPEISAPLWLFPPESLKLSWRVPFEMVLIEMESGIPLLTLKWRDCLLDFPSFSGNTEDALLTENSNVLYVRIILWAKYFHTLLKILALREVA